MNYLKHKIRYFSRGVDDLRLVDWIKTCDLSSLPKRTKSKGVCLLSFPFDEGTIRNKGRQGSSNGPDVFRQQLYKIGSLDNPEFDLNLLRFCEIYDVGNVEIMKNNFTLEEIHEKLRESVSKIVKQGYIPFIVGGSNDQSFPNALGLLDTFEKKSDFAVINLDAHLDCRPLNTDGLPHSGSPFFQLLKHPNWSGQFIEFGTQGHQCSRKHSEFVTRYKGDIVWYLKYLKGRKVGNIFGKILNSMRKNHVFVSFDVDSISSAWCDSVSCPSPLGFTAEQALQICFQAGQFPFTSLVDISEFNPLIGNSDKTGRLLATMFYYFILGLSSS